MEDKFGPFAGQDQQLGDWFDKINGPPQTTNLNSPK